MEKNVNTDRKLLFAIYEIKRDKNKECNSDDYIYEFLATSNNVYNLGDNRIEFYGVKKKDNGKLFFHKFKVIPIILFQFK